MRSALLEEVRLEVLVEFKVLSSPSTNCTDWDAALASLVCAGEAVFFRSPKTVANADWAVDRLPELSALPSEVRSVESWELLKRLVPFAVAEFCRTLCRVWNAD